MQSLADRIRYLISKGKVKEALKQLQHIDAFEEDLQAQIHVLNGRYRQLERQEIKGILSREAFNLENNRITNALLLLIDDFPDDTTLLNYKLNRLAKSLAISTEQVQTVMAALEERYQSRLHQKMDNYLSLSLKLSYTQEGTAQTFVETFFDEDSKGTDFIHKNCLEVLKQHQHLLILGNPGAGKTTLLLQLAHSLLQQYEELQIPIVFNLASWTAKESTFKQWLQNILVNGYGFSAEFAAKSLAQNTILPLLDGFDEIGKAYEEVALQNELRQHCLEAIGQYVSNENVEQFIICSRRKEYEAVPQNAPIRAEILVNPLSIQQIEAALTQQKNNTPTNKERTLLRKLSLLKEQQHSLLEILCTPFYFNLIFDTKELTHTLSDINQLPQRKVEIEQYLLSEFIHKKINNVIHFSKSKTRHYLSWLASWMNGREAVSFELADLQPDDLKRRWLFGFVFGMGYSIVYYLIYILVSCLAYFLVDGIVFKLVENFRNCLINGLLFGIAIALVINFNKNLTIHLDRRYSPN